MIIIFILFFLLLLEEIFYRLSRGSSYRNIDLTVDSVDERAGTGRFTRLLSWIRVTQLLVFALLWAVTAALSGVRVMYTADGKLAGLLLLIQVVRILNRKIINQWAVLGVTMILQVLLLILLLPGGLTPETFIDTDTGESGWILSLVSFVLLFLLSITFPFSVTYFLRLFAREGSEFFYSLPTVAYSEYWIRRITRVSAHVAVFPFLFQVFLIVKYEYPPGTVILHTVILFVLIFSTYFFRNRSKLHHPVAVFLVSAVWVINIVWIMTDLTSVSSGWIA